MAESVLDSKKDKNWALVSIRNLYAEMRKKKMLGTLPVILSNYVINCPESLMIEGRDRWFKTKRQSISGTVVYRLVKEREAAKGSGDRQKKVKKTYSDYDEIVQFDVWINETAEDYSIATKVYAELENYYGTYRINKMILRNSGVNEKLGDVNGKIAMTQAFLDTNYSSWLLKEVNLSTEEIIM